MSIPQTKLKVGLFSSDGLHFLLKRFLSWVCLCWELRLSLTELVEKDPQSDYNTFFFV